MNLRATWVLLIEEQNHSCLIGRAHFAKHTRSNSSRSGGSSSIGSSNGSRAEGADAGSHAPKLAALWLVLGIALVC